MMTNSLQPASINFNVTVLYQAAKKTEVVLGNLGELNAHSVRRTIFARGESRRPDHLTANIYWLVAGGLNNDAKIFFQGRYVFA